MTSIELQAGPYYLSVKCGPNAQRFRTVAFEVRGKLTGPGDAVHGEICPMEWLYHSVVPTFETAAGRRLTEEESEIEARRNGRRLGRRHRRLGSAMGAAETVQPGDHVQVAFPPPFHDPSMTVA